MHILILFMPIGLFFHFRRLHEEDVLIILFAVTTVYFAGSLIRLLLILAPAASLVGSYGITRLIGPYSDIFQKKFVTSRRRKRFSKIVSRETSVGIVAIVSFLTFLTVTHGIYTAAYQLSSSVMIPGGLEEQTKFHDWEETWSWMHASLASGSVVTSWWDYGYWITSAGNATSSADNGTKNSTQIGMIGRLMMATDEMEAVDICKILGTTHILVYWGYYTGLGGDEGKWVWMVKIGYENTILNEVTYSYDISDYWVETATGASANKSFLNSLLFKMLTANEPYYKAAYKDNDATVRKYNFLIGSYLTQLHSGTDSDGDPWSQTIETPERLGSNQGNLFSGYGIDIPESYILQEPTYFKTAFASSNHLVKVYYVDYIKAGLRINITDSIVYDSGISIINVKNIGDRNCTLDALKIEGTEYKYDLLQGTGQLAPGETAVIRAYGANLTKDANVEISLDIYDPEVTSNRFTATASDVVTEAPVYSFSIDESNSYLYSNDTIHIKIENNGSDYIKIDTIQLHPKYVACIEIT
ncbi:MAG: hypothetical protein JRJ62_16460 [Deltaproteobacteria bacterium]|nr:hypothetical protein [Deltaproteobacteria bacterium]